MACNHGFERGLIYSCESNLQKNYVNSSHIICDMPNGRSTTAPFSTYVSNQHVVSNNFSPSSYRPRVSFINQNNYNSQHHQQHRATPTVHHLDNQHHTIGSPFTNINCTSGSRGPRTVLLNVGPNSRFHQLDFSQNSVAGVNATITGGGSYTDTPTASRGTSRYNSGAIYLAGAGHREQENKSARRNTEQQHPRYHSWHEDNSLRSEHWNQYQWQTAGGSSGGRFQQRDNRHHHGPRSTTSSSSMDQHQYPRQQGNNNTYHSNNNSMASFWRSNNNNSGTASSWNETSGASSSHGNRGNNNNNNNNSNYNNNSALSHNNNSSSSSSSWANSGNNNIQGNGNNNNNNSNSRRRNNYNWGNTNWHSYGRGYKNKRQRKDDSQSPKNKNKNSSVMTEEELAQKLAEVSGPAYPDRTKCDDAIDPISQARIWDDDIVEDDGGDLSEGSADDDRSTRLPSSISERTTSASSSSTARDQETSFLTRGNASISRREDEEDGGSNGAPMTGRFGRKTSMETDEDFEENDVSQDVRFRSATANQHLHHRHSCLLFPGSSAEEEEFAPFKDGNRSSSPTTRGHNRGGDADRSTTGLRVQIAPKRKVQRRKANYSEIRYLFSYTEKNPATGKEFVRGFSIESFQQVVLQAKKNETYPKVLHPVTGTRLPDADLKRGEQMVKILVQAGRLDQVEDEDPTTWTLEDIRASPATEVYPKLKKLSFSVFQSFFAKASIEVPDDAIPSLGMKDLKALAKEAKGMYLRNFEPSQRRQLCPQSNGAAFCDLPYWEHDAPPWIHFILSNIHYVLTANKAAPEHLVKMAMYVFTGAIATICPSVRERYQDSFAMDFDFPARGGEGGTNITGSNNNSTTSANNNPAGNNAASDPSHHEEEEELFALDDEHDAMLE